jgi:hypothetical protein
VGPWSGILSKCRSCGCGLDDGKRHENGGRRGNEQHAQEPPGQQGKHPDNDEDPDKQHVAGKNPPTGSAALVVPGRRIETHGKPQMRAQHAGDDNSHQAGHEE